MKNKIATLLIILILIISVSGCGTTKNSSDNGNSSGTNTSSTKTGSNESSSSAVIVQNGTVTVPDEATNGNSDASADTIITLSDTEIKISGKGASAEGSVLTITDSGTYLISGKLSDGQIIVNSSGTEKVKLIFNGVDIYCSSSAAVYVVQSADKVIIELPYGSVNKLSDGESRAAADESDAALYSKDDLKIKGDGALYITGNYGKGINTKDDLKIEEASVYIVAKDDGMRGKDSIKIDSGYIVIEAGGDGLRTNNETDEGKGYIEINDGHIEVTAELDAIQTATDLTINGGELILTCGGGSANSSTSQNSDWGNWGGGKGGMMPGMNNGQTSTSSEDTASAKALKAAGNVTINGGVLNIDSSDDSIHSNDIVTINGGTLDMASGDDGIHADSVLTINGGTITISKSYEGLESANITINGGTISVTSSDDGLNSAGGNDASSLGGRPGQNGFESSDGSLISVTGGTLTVNAKGDGIDSNGDITMTGGSVVVFGPTDNGNGALDYAGSFKMDGGSLVAFGSTGMAQSISTGSKQAALAITLSGTANSVFKVTDSSGKVICEETSPKQYGCIVVSTPEITSGSKYSCWLNGSKAGSVTAK